MHPSAWKGFLRRSRRASGGGTMLVVERASSPEGGERKGVGLMEVFAKYEVRDTITDREQVLHIRQVIGAHLQRIFESGKVRASGVFVGARGGFFVFDVDSSDELFEMLVPIVDYVRMETHPLTSVEKLGEFFEKDAVAGG
jgi:muconolactone delta-isomerase